MKRPLFFLFTLTMFTILSGCSGSDTPPEIDLSQLNDLPVISIETKSNAKNAMDFVTKPVASHVSEAIASWTPGYEMPPAPYYEACTVTLTDTDQTVLLCIILHRLGFVDNILFGSKSRQNCRPQGCKAQSYAQERATTRISHLRGSIRGDREEEQQSGTSNRTRRVEQRGSIPRNNIRRGGDVRPEQKQHHDKAAL